MNDSNVGSGVHSDLEILETKDETENSKKKSSAASLRANPLYLSEGINENSDEVSDSDDEPYVPSTDSEEESEDDDYESSEDEVITPNISIEENDEMKKILQHVFKRILLLWKFSMIQTR